jgi:hypothetical protein
MHEQPGSTQACTLVGEIRAVPKASVHVNLRCMGDG